MIAAAAGLEIDAGGARLNAVMSFAHPKLKPILAALAAIVMFSLPWAAPLSAQAPDRAQEAELLAALAQSDAAEAARIDRQLRALWAKSGSAAMDLLLQRGRDALEAEDLAAAIEHLTALTDHAPDFAEGWHARATAYFGAGLLGPALADLERALALNPNNYHAIYGLGTILESLGDETHALEAYARAGSIHPHQKDIAEAQERLRPSVKGKAL